MQIKVIDREGETHEVPWAEDQSLMEALRDNDLPVLASCGGQRSCATCHVYIDSATHEKIGSAEGEELELLEEAEGFDASCSRLSCQIKYDSRLEGINPTIAPEDW